MAGGRRWQQAPGWPVTAEGLVMANFGQLLVVRLDRGITSAAFDLHLDALARAIDERVRGRRVGVLYDQRGGFAGDARQRARTAELLKARRQALAESTAAYAMVTESAIVKGILRAIFWLEAPPYPWSVASSLEQAVTFLGGHMPGLDVEQARIECEAVLAQTPT